MIHCRFRHPLGKREPIYDKQTLRSDRDHLSEKFTVLDVSDVKFLVPSAETGGGEFMTCADG